MNSSPMLLRNIELEATAVQIENDIRSSTLFGTVDYRFPLDLILHTRYEFSNYSDSNIKQKVRADLYKSITKGNPRLTIGYGFEFLSFARNLSNGYFNPSNYLAHTVNMYLESDILAERVFFSIFAFFGAARTGGQPDVVAEFDNI